MSRPDHGSVVPGIAEVVRGRASCGCGLFFLTVIGMHVSHTLDSFGAGESAFATYFLEVPGSTMNATLRGNRAFAGRDRMSATATPTSVAEVVAHMRAIENSLPWGDAVACFLSLYREVTEDVRDDSEEAPSPIRRSWSGWTSPSPASCSPPSMPTSATCAPRPRLGALYSPLALSGTSRQFSSRSRA
jgi:hypothetical protein